MTFYVRKLKATQSLSVVDYLLGRCHALSLAAGPGC